MVSSKKGTVDAAENKTAVKAAAPVVDKKTPEKQAEVKAEGKPEEPKKEEVKKEEVKKPEAKKAEVKKTETKKAAEPKAKKTSEKKENTVKNAFYVQYAGKEYTEKELLAEVKKAYTKLGHKAADIKSVEIYLKPEENVAYYVINGQGSDEYKIVL